MKRKLTDYRPDPNNANQHSERGMSMLEDSLSQVGAGRSLVADKNDILLAGNGVQEVASSMGFDEVIEVETDGDALIVHKRRDLDLLNDPDHKARKLSLYDNRVQELSLTWKPEALEQYKLEGVQLERMWTPVELEEVGVGQGEPVPDSGAQVDKAQELQAKWQVKPGDLFQVGAHKILCGDSTKAEDVARVMGGEKADAVVTDPPYGQNQDGVTNDQPENLHDNIFQSIKNLPCDNAVIVAFQSPRTFPKWLDATRQSGYAFERMLWMYKAAQNSYPWRGWILKSESILVSSKGIGHWQEKHPYSHDCYYMSEVSGELPENSGWHGSVKPLHVVLDICERVCEIGDLVFDPFLGSGTTLVACEQLNRRGRGIEIEPKYVAVCLERLSQMGLEVNLITE